MENNGYIQVREKIKNLQRAIVQRAIIKDAYILVDAKNYIDLIYNNSFQSKNEDVQEWFKIKDVILLSNLHYIRNQKDAYIYNNEINNIEYNKILNILNEYQKYMKKNSLNYNIPYFDFENEIKIKKLFQSDYQSSNDVLDDEQNIYYSSCYNANAKILKIKKIYNDAVVNDNLSVFAVIHNLLVRTKVIPKTDYIAKLHLNDQELNSVYYFQMIILNAIKSGIFQLNEKNKIAVNKSNIENVKIACDNLNYYINLFNHLVKDKIESLKCTVVENHQNGIEINEKNISYEIINDEGRVHNLQPIWIEKRIKYNFSQENKLHYEKLLSEVFKYKEFRKGQLEIISNVVQSTNEQVNVAILPTGYGKSFSV